MIMTLWLCSYSQFWPMSHGTQLVFHTVASARQAEPDLRCRGSELCGAVGYSETEATKTG